MFGPDRCILARVPSFRPPIKLHGVSLSSHDKPPWVMPPGTSMAAGWRRNRDIICRLSWIAVNLHADHADT